MQNIRLLNTHKHLANLHVKGKVTSDTKATQSFMSILNNSIESPSARSSVKTQLSVDKEIEMLQEIPEDGPRYCSLCGSQIDEKGNCPICIIPLCISGDQLNQQAQSTSEAQSVSPLQGNTDMNLMLGMNTAKIKKYSSL